MTRFLRFGAALFISVCSLLPLPAQQVHAQDQPTLSTAEGIQWFQDLCMQNITRLDVLTDFMMATNGVFEELRVGFYRHSSDTFAVVITPQSIGVCTLMFISTDPYGFTSAQVESLARGIDSNAFSNGKGKFLVSILGNEYFIFSDGSDGMNSITIMQK